jgi:hypothetical protein
MTDPELSLGKQRALEVVDRMHRASEAREREAGILDSSVRLEQPVDDLLPEERLELQILRNHMMSRPAIATEGEQ